MYTSTRSKMRVNASEAIINGIAPDGGLYIPLQINKVKLKELLNLNYQELAIVILENFLNDFSHEEIKDIVYKAYDEKFLTRNIVDVKKCSDSYFLELFHGPTLAFKDVALSILPLLMQKSKEINNVNDKTVILTATSGDTGSAALSGFYYSNNTDMVVFYPTEGISKIQENQMLSFRSERLHPIALKGNFDDAQSLVKKIFNDDEIKKYLKDQNIILSSANSINIGRLIPQVVYYFYSYADLYKKGEIELNEEVNFVVPTGNFGNILACYIAKEMGLPVKKLICASNENNVLTDFFKKGEYNKNRQFYKTVSPSMDILISSNLERLLYLISKDEIKVNKLMKDLNGEGFYSLDEDFKDSLNDFYADFATEEETLEAIKKVWNENNYLIDTHTAVGYSVYKKYVCETRDETKTVIASTAHPYKFPKAICKALEIDDADEFELIAKLVEKTKETSNRINNLNNKFIKEVWSKEEAVDKLKQIFSK